MYDIAIIGGGPGGLTAGMYAGRARLRTIIIDKDCPAGKCRIHWKSKITPDIR